MLKYILMDLSLKELIYKIDYCKDIIQTQEDSICKFRDAILKTPNKFRKEKIGFHEQKIFIGGSGRSGLVAKSFAMRLMQLGFNTYVFGESIIPAVEEDDIIITISNSGNSRSIDNIFDNINRNKIKILSVCGNISSSLANKSDNIVLIPEIEKKSLTQYDKNRLDNLNFSPDELVLLGSTFEISAFIILDVLIVELMNELGLKEKNLKDMHDNLSSFIS